MRRSSAPFNLYGRFASIFGSPLIGNKIENHSQPRQEVSLATLSMMKGFHHKEFTVNGIVSLVKQGRLFGHPLVTPDHIPALLFSFEPISEALSILFSRELGDFFGKSTQFLSDGGDRSPFKKD